MTSAPKIHPDSWQVGGYKILDKIGSGATSVVYKCEKLGRPYAIKIMSEAAGADAAEIELRLRREASALSRLDHPGVVRVEEVGRDGDTVFIVMELVEGQTLRELLNSKTVYQEKITALLGNVALTLASVHRLGIIHRDIKPENIIVLPDLINIKLIDFGFVTGDNEIETGHTVVGSLQYSSPEQLGALRRVVDHRSDLYSFGAVLYEALTGRLLFESTSISELIRCHSTVAPTPPQEIRPDIRPEVSQILLKLLAKDPDDRYLSTVGLAWDLEHLELLASETGTYQLDRKSRNQAPTHVLPLIGRDDDLEILREKIKAARAGAGSFTLVEGPSGSGKTRLIDELLRSDAVGIIPIFNGKAQESETTQFSPLREAFEKMLVDLRDDQEVRQRFIRCAGENAFLLRKLSRGLDGLFKDAVEVPSLAPELERERYENTIVDFICALAKSTQGLFFHIGDVQWLDLGTKSVLLKLAARIQSSRVAVFMSGRNDSASVEMITNFAGSLPAASLTRIVLATLSKDHVNQLILAFLGTKSFNPKFVDRIYDASAGNPFAVTEYLRSMIDNGILFPKGDSWDILEDEFAKIAVSKTVIQLVVDRLSKLNSNVRNILECAAVEGMKFRVETLVSAANAELDVFRGLEEAVFGGFIHKSHKDLFEFVHDSVRESLILGINADRLYQINQRIADHKYKNNSKTPEAYYEMARYFQDGVRGRNEEALFEVSFFAGLYALQIFSNEEAFSLLETAHQLVAHAKDQDTRLRVEESIALASTRVVKFKKALEHLEIALTLATTKLQKARVLLAKASTQSNEGLVSESWQTIIEGLDVLGARFPKYAVTQFVTLLYAWFLLVVLGKTNIGFGSAKAKEIERRKLISQNYSLGKYQTYYLGKIFAMTQLFIHDVVNSHFIGVCAENVGAQTLYGFLMAMFQIRRPATNYIESAMAMAESLGDKSALTGSRLFQAYITQFSGDANKADSLFLNVIPEVKKYCVTRERSESHSGHVIQYAYLGQSQKAIGYYNKSIANIDEWNNTVQRSNFRCCCYPEFALTGRHKEALQLRSEILEISRLVPDVKFCQVYVYASHILVLLDREDFGQEIEENIQKLLSLKFDEPWNRYAHIIISYVRLRQLQLAEPKVRPYWAKKLKWARRRLALTALIPAHRCHLHIIRGYELMARGKTEKAKRAFERGLEMAIVVGSNWGLFEGNVAMARAQSDEKARQHYAQVALKTAYSEGWENRIKRTLKEFNIVDNKTASVGSASIISSGIRQIKYKDQTTALLNVGQVLSNSLSFDVQVSVALDEVRKLLRADRAFLFADVKDQLKLIKGKNSEGDIDNASSVSNTAVNEAFQTGKHVLFAGTKDAEELGSKSAIVHDLRSVLAVPMSIHGQKKGVIYVDSSLAKGLFSDDDVGILSAVANQIAISLENGRLARLEVSRKELEKDMELTSAVQRMFLPKEAQVRLSQYQIHGFYRPAAKCGGDWWWYRAVENRTWAFVGDVTGHGANAAMITAAIASCFRSLESSLKTLPELMAAAHELLFAITKGEYWMPALAFEVDESGKSLMCWSAGSPTMYVLRKGQKIERFRAAASKPLGCDPQCELSEFKLALNPGDRVFISTDGIVEQQLPDGKIFGERHYMKIMESSQDLEAGKVIDSIIQQVDKRMAESAQEDDFTLVMLEIS